MAKGLLIFVTGLFVLLFFLSLVRRIIGAIGIGRKFREFKPYVKRKSIFTPAERSFYGVLKDVIKDNAEIFAKIRVADIIAPSKQFDRSNRQKAFNKISGKHFDFVICDKKTLSVLCVIELNDSSHNSAKRIERDEFLKEVCRSADIPLLFWKARGGYFPMELKQVLSNYIDFSESESESIAEGTSKNRICPKCNSPMVIKVAKKGKNQGKKFLACSNFPKCRYIEPID